MSDNKTNTTVKTVDVSVDAMDTLLGSPGAASVMTPEEGAPPVKPSFFTKEKVDMSVYEESEPPASEGGEGEEEKPAATEDGEEKPEGETTGEPAGETGSFGDLVDGIEGDPNDIEKNKGGRPALDKGGMAQLTEALIKDKVIFPFDDDKKLEDYTMDDFKELIVSNFTNQKEELQASTPKEFFEQLPQELQYAAQYVADGGTDMKGLFRALAASEETKTISIDTEQGQEQTVRQFLYASNFGTDEEIQEQIDSWKDLEKLETKATQFKPKLDKMQDQIVQRQLHEQQGKKKQQEDASKQYAESVYNTLEKGELNGLHMSNKIQNMLYQGLIQPNYPSVSGQNTNLFGHLIEKHQFVEPDHGLIAEALWLLADPKGYRAEIAKGANNEAVTDTVKKLKIEQANKTANGTEAEPGKGGAGKTRTIKKPNGGFFKRNNTNE